MAVRCLKCGYEMSSWQEFCSAFGKIFGSIYKSETKNIVAGFLNAGPEKIECPKCGATGRWEDI
jgi:Zn ribbon nucleic-acid-binding protein